MSDVAWYALAAIFFQFILSLLGATFGARLMSGHMPKSISPQLEVVLEALVFVSVFILVSFVYWPVIMIVLFSVV